MHQKSLAPPKKKLREASSPQNSRPKLTIRTTQETDRRLLPPVPPSSPQFPRVSLFRRAPAPRLPLTVGLLITALCLALLLAACTTPPVTIVIASPTPTHTPVIGEAEVVPTATPLVAATQPTLPPTGPAATSTPVPVDTTPRVTANNSAVNLRLGPGTHYEVVSVLPQGQSLEIVGRSADSAWWQVISPAGLLWIAAGVTTASNITPDIPIVSAPPPPTNTPTPTPPPLPTPTPTPTQQPYQYTIRNIFGQVNEAITQIRGNIQDRNGNPVNGVRVRVRSGSFCTVSYPSGPQGGYPNGVYDILLDDHAKVGQWLVAVVNGPANPTDTQCNSGLAVLSEEVTVPTDTREGVVFVEWWKNY